MTYVIFHVFACFSVLRFFAVSNSSAKKAVIAAFVLLGVSFFAAIFLYHYRDNFFTRQFYFLSGLWIGFLINLVLFFMIAWLAAVTFRFSGVEKNNKLIASLAIAAATAFSIYGIWNAFNPVVKRISVDIENLPENWSGKKIVHISDAHLGHVYGNSHLREIVGKINALKPDIIAITGDLFDQIEENFDIFAESLGELKSEKGIFYVTGNHETYLGKERILAAARKAGMIALQDEARMLEGLQVIGIDYPDRMDTKDIAGVIGKIDGFDAQKPSVLLWHTPSHVEEIKRAGIDLQLSGHAHKGQIFPFGFITAAVFKGYDYGLKREGNFSIYTTSGVGTWGPAMRTQKRSEIVEITLR